jgi:hypothetical protein
MAVTFTGTTPVRVRSIGDVYEMTYLIGCSGTATDNGDALTFATLGVTNVEYAECTPAVDSPVTGAWVVYYDIVNQKVVFLAMGAVASAVTPLSEITAGTAVGTRTFRLTLHAKGPVRGPSM